MRQDTFYIIEKNELKKFLNFSIKESKKSVFSFIENLLTLLENEKNIFLFKKNEILRIGEFHFLIKKENQDLTKIILYSSFLTTAKIIESAVVRFEFIKIKKGHYFRIVPSIYISVLLGGKNLILPEILEIKESQEHSSEMLEVLLK